MNDARPESQLLLGRAEAGARVAVLEKGRYYSVRDFTHDEIAIALEVSATTVKRDLKAPWALPQPTSISTD